MTRNKERIMSWILFIVFALGLFVTILPALFQSRLEYHPANCLEHLLRIESAKRQYYLDFPDTDFNVDLILEDLVGDTLYLRVTPRCPDGGSYILGSKQEATTCTAGHKLPKR